MKQSFADQNFPEREVEREKTKGEGNVPYPNLETGETPPPVVGWVLYDDSCGFCSGWILAWASTLRGRGYGVAPLQSRWVRDQLKLSEHELLFDVRLLLVDGTQLKGADVYRHVLRRIWWTYPLFLFACAPGFRRLFDLVYRMFAKHRFRFSKACGMRGS